MAVFQSSLPKYRLGFFKELTEDTKHSITFFVSDADQNREPGAGAEGGLPLEPARMYRAKLPFSASHLKLTPTAIRVLLQGHYDVMILGNDLLAAEVWICCLVARLLGRGICLWGHGFSRPDTLPRQFLRRQLISMASSALFYTEETRQTWLARGLPAEKLFVAPNSLDTENIAKVKGALTSAQLEDFRREQGVTGKKVVIFCGRLTQRKRPELLLRALSLVLHAIPQVHAFVVGDGPLGPRLRSLSQELGLTRAVSFFGAVFDEATLAKCFLCSDVAVVPAAAGLNVQHAFGYGTPVIAGDEMEEHGPEIALVKEGVTGLLCRSGDPSSFANAICRLLQDERLKRRMGSAAQQLVQQKFNLKLMTRGFWEGVDHCHGTQIQSPDAIGRFPEPGH